MAERESSLAVLVDFENMARPGAKGRGDFDIHLVLNRLAEKGRVLVKRAYADWSRYRDARHELQNAGLGLIEMPSAREGAKNRADIQMAVDAMELAYSREHVNNFVIVSGDSDFTPLVGKLRELNKRVIGVGNRESASELLIANCDEFIFYDRLAAAGRRRRTPRRRGGSGPTSTRCSCCRRPSPRSSARASSGRSRASSRTRCAASTRPSTRASTASRTFSKFLEEAAQHGHRAPGDRPAQRHLPRGAGRGPRAAAAAARRPRAAGRRARAARRATAAGGGGAAARRAEPRDGRAADAGRGARADGPRCSRSSSPRRPTLDLGTLPPLDEPISYEDMIMLGPEVGEDVPELAEASDVAAAASPPSRSTGAAGAAARRPTPSRRSPTWSRSTPDEAAEPVEPRSRGRRGAVAEAVAPTAEDGGRRRAAAAVAARPPPRTSAGRPTPSRRSRRPSPTPEPPRPRPRRAAPLRRAAACAAGPTAAEPEAARRGRRAGGRGAPRRRPPSPSGARARRPSRPPRRRRPRPWPSRGRGGPQAASGARARRPSRPPRRPGEAVAEPGPRRPPSRSGARARRPSRPPRRLRSRPSAEAGGRGGPQAEAAHAQEGRAGAAEEVPGLEPGLGGGRDLLVEVARRPHDLVLRAPARRPGSRPAGRRRSGPAAKVTNTTAPRMPPWSTSRRRRPRAPGTSATAMSVIVAGVVRRTSSTPATTSAWAASSSRSVSA